MVLPPPNRHANFIRMAVTAVAQPSDARPIETADLVEGTLPKACWIRFDNVVMLSESRIVNTFGTVSPQTQQRVLQELCSVVGYTRT